MPQYLRILFSQRRTFPCIDHKGLNQDVQSVRVYGTFVFHI